MMTKRSTRPRDALGRPLPHDAAGEPRVPDDLVLPPRESLAEAQRLFDAGRPFHAHEVLEGTWKASPPAERDLWQGLAQLAVGITHRCRGNAVGAARLLRRGAARIEPYAADTRYGLDVVGLATTARDLADDPSLSTPLRLDGRPNLLRELRDDDEAAALEAHEQVLADNMDFLLDHEPGTPWADYVRLQTDRRRGIGLPRGRVPATFLVADVDGAIVGRLSIRHTLNEFLATYGGHIGYAVVPAYRRRGYATAMLREGLVRARMLGIERALVTCDEDNPGSRKAIESCGGRLDADRPTIGERPAKLRYWIG